jgi:hypothetical protein
MAVLHDNAGNAVGNGNPFPIRSMQQKWRAGFSGTELNPNKWEIISVGEGQSVTVLNGSLVANLGTVADAETIIRSIPEFDIPYRAMMNIALSQRIAGNEVYFEMVSIDRESGEVNTHSLAGWLFDGTSATQAKYTVNGGDQPILTSVASTVLTTATPLGSIFEIEPTTDECWFFSRSIDATTGRSSNYVRHSQIPSASLRYKLQIRIKNQAVAPLTNTILYSQFANVSDYAEITAEITAGRGNAVAGQGIFATVGGTLSSVSTITTVTTSNVVAKNAPAAVTVAAITTATPFTSAAIDAGSTMIYTKYRVRVIFDQPVKVELINGTSATVSANKVTASYDVPANTPTILEMPLVARYAAVKITNTGVATTTVHDALGILLGL